MAAKPDYRASLLFEGSTRKGLSPLDVTGLEVRIQTHVIGPA